MGSNLHWYEVGEGPGDNEKVYYCDTEEGRYVAIVHLTEGRFGDDLVTRTLTFVPVPQNSVGKPHALG